MSRRWGVALLAAALQPAVVAGPAALWTGFERVASDAVCAALTLLAVAHAAAEAGSQRDDDVARDGVDRALAGATAAALWAIFAGAIALRAQAPTSNGPWGAIGVALVAGGIALRAAAVRALGGDFVTDARAGEVLVARGVFAWARHPSEAGLCAMAAGVLALVPHPAIAAVFATILAPSMALRIAREDRVLAARAPLEHARYAARVGALVPRAGALRAALRRVRGPRASTGQSGESAFAMRFSTPTNRNGEQ